MRVRPLGRPSSVEDGPNGGRLESGEVAPEAISLANDLTRAHRRANLEARIDIRPASRRGRGLACLGEIG